MARGFGARETSRSLKTETVSDAGSNAAKVFDYVRSEYAKLYEGKKLLSSGTPEFERSEELRKMRENAEKSVVRAVNEEAKKHAGEEAPSYKELMKAENNKLTPEEEKAYREKYGELGDGKVGNGVLREDGKVELRDSDIAFMLSTFEGFDFVNPDSVGTMLERGGEHDELAFIAFRGLSRDSAKRPSIEIEGSIDVADGDSDDDSAPEITGASFSEDDVIKQFGEMGVVITPTQATTVVTYIENAYVGKTRELSDSELESNRRQRADERADDIIRRRKYGDEY